MHLSKQKNKNYNNQAIIITGPSGVGKTTIAHKLLEKNKNLEKVITYTSRKKRAKEINGIDYNFITEKKFKEKIRKRELFEWAIVYDNYYGNSKLDLQNIWKKNKTAIFVVDIQGAIAIQKKLPQSLSIFIKPDSIINLLNRLKRRDKIQKEDFKARTTILKNELKLAKKCDFRVINKENQINQAVQNIAKIITKKLKINIHS
jgi:guanylate kinase